MKKITLLKGTSWKFMMFLLSFLFINLVSNKALAQPFCASEFIYWTEDFGTGANSSNYPNVVNLNYDPSGPLEKGTYRLRDWTDQRPGWHKSADHTPNDVNGKSLIINGDNERFFRRTVIRQQGYAAGFYAVSFWAMNLSIPGTCTSPVLPTIQIRAQYRDANNDWVEMINSPVTLAPLPETATPVWVQGGGVFTLPTTGTFVVRRIRFFLSDANVAGCGNDFAIDDLKFSSCPLGGPLPVQFLDVTAKKKGSGVAIDWATASEFNNKYFDVEKSTDGINWNLLASTPTKGNGTSTKNYGAYDAQPVAGINYYRIRQVDTDGNSKYSSTVTYKLVITKTEVSVLANPFNSNITVDFLSTRTQVVSARLFDITGKQVLSQQLSLSKGTTRKVFNEVNRLNRGMYILHIIDDTGAIIYNDKLIKQ